MFNPRVLNGWVENNHASFVFEGTGHKAVLGIGKFNYFQRQMDIFVNIRIANLCEGVWSSEKKPESDLELEPEKTWLTSQVQETQGAAFGANIFKYSHQKINLRSRKLFFPDKGGVN